MTRRTPRRTRRPRPAAPARNEPAAARAHVEDMLDEALMQTFPASDPVTLKACDPDRPSRASAGTDPVPRR